VKVGQGEVTLGAIWPRCGNLLVKVGQGKALVKVGQGKIAELLMSWAQ
jgi:hypothetical protein